MKLLQTILLSTAIALAAPYAGAQNAGPGQVSPDALQGARELVAIISANVLTAITTKSVEDTWPPIDEALRREYPTIDAATLAELRSEFERLQISVVTQTMNEAPAIYARYFTAHELREIVAFYLTPTGAKALRTMPQAMNDMFIQIGPRLQASSAQVQLVFAEILQKRGYRR